MSIHTINQAVALTDEESLETLKRVLEVIPKEFHEKLPQDKLPNVTQLGGAPPGWFYVRGHVFQAFSEHFGARKFLRIRERFWEAEENGDIVYSDDVPNYDERSVKEFEFYTNKMKEEQNGQD